MMRLLSAFGLLSALALASCSGSEASQGASTASAKTPDAPAARSGGIALYTLREDMGRDPRATLAAVADLGYAYVEAAGYAPGEGGAAGTFYGMAPEAFAALLDSLGLAPKSTHMGMATRDNVDRLAADTRAAGFEYFVLPVPPMGAFGVDEDTRTMLMKKPVAEVMADVNLIASRVRAAGLACLYHNHDFEFKPNADGLVPIEYFLEHSDPGELAFQMDLFWVTKAGADPVDYINRYPGRWRSFHVKDMDAEGRFAPVGTGSIDFARVLAERERAGLAFFLVEQDATYDGQTPLEAVAQSREGLGALGL